MCVCAELVQTGSVVIGCMGGTTLLRRYWAVVVLRASDVSASHGWHGFQAWDTASECCHVYTICVYPSATISVL